MIAFYACTNTQIMNMINVKLQYYPNDLADLLVLKKSRIDLNFIKCIKESGCFNRIVFIDPYVCDKSKISKIYYYFVDRAPKKYYFKQLEQYIGKNIYDKILTFGFWADALYILLYLYKLNKRIDIEFVEEGLVNYFAYKKKLYYCRAYSGVKEKLIRVCEFGFDAFSLKKNIRVLYLYRPEYVIDIDKDVFLIKQIRLTNNKSTIIKKIFFNYGKVIKEKIELYKKIKNIYVLDNYDINRHKELIRDLVNNCGSESFLIKLHPENTVAEIKQLKNSLPEVNIDDSNFYFETLAIYIDFKNKYIYSRFSSISYILPITFNIECKNILLYKKFYYKDNMYILKNADKFWNYINNEFKKHLIFIE